MRFISHSPDLSHQGSFCIKSNNYVTLSDVEDGREGLVEWLSALNHQILTVASLPQDDF
jgi:hypothetical protein